jgi:SpoIID/LytB domain protein
MPLIDEANDADWVNSAPPSYSDTDSHTLLKRILPGFDQETSDFYRWRVEYSQEELRSILSERLGFDPGAILSIAALERGESGRIVRLRITGEQRTVIVGKELEIRRTLSRSHLYSSAFVVESEGRSDSERSSDSEPPEHFVLIGAGWGHGVGLCQIGAAVMAEGGYEHREILNHYFRGTTITQAYD